MWTTLLCLSVLAQQDPVTTLRVIDNLEFRGVESFEVAEIRAALSRDGETWRQLQATTGQRERARLLAGRVREGYLQAGHADASVEPQAGEQIVLEVTEGPVFLCGAVRASGCKAVAAAEIEAAVAATGPGYEGWVDGTVARCAPMTMAKVMTQLQRAYLVRGRHGARGLARFARRGGRMDLLLEVLDEGREVRIGKLELVGERKGEGEAVLEAMAVAPGALYTTAFAADLHKRLEQLGRYRSIRMPDGTGVLGDLDPFPVQVVVEPKAPPFAELRRDDLAQLQRARDWLQRELQRGTSMRADITVPEALAWGGLVLGPGKVSVWLARDGLLVGTDALAIGPGPARVCTLRTSPSEVRMRFGAECGVLEFDNSSEVQVSLVPTVAGPELVEFRWDVGWQQRKVRDEKALEGSMRLLASDAALALLLHDSELQNVREGEDLVLAGKLGSVRVKADGSLTGSVTTDGWGTPCSLSIDPRALGVIEASLGSQVPVRKAVPMTTFLAVRALEVGGPAFVRLPERWRDALPLVTAFWRHVAETLPATGPSKPQRRYSLPAGPADTGLHPRLVQAMLHEAASGIDPGSCVSTTLLAFPDLVLGRADDRKAALARMELLLGRKESGPLAFLVQAWVLQAAGLPEASVRHAKAGLERLDFERAFADVHAMSPAGGSTDAWLQGLGARWRAQPDLRETFAGIAEQGVDGDRKALELGLRRLWDAVLQDLVRTLLENVLE